MKLFRHIFVVIALAAMAFPAVGAENLNGSGTLRFGWKLDRCTKVIGDMSRYSTTTDPGDTKLAKFSYSPATWESIAFDGSVLDFYKEKLYQIGFFKTTDIADRSTFDAVVKRLTDTYGEPKRLKADDPDRLLWRAKNGNMAMVEYNYADNKFSTYLMLIDNAATMKKAKERISH
ncbi:MAG: hypothetical protein K2M98_01870 [Muribaculum sp.]|nr:hypothetical protein [Muribaculum sp.]